MRAADAARLAGLNHLADDARVVGQSQLAAFDAERRPADDRVVGLVPEEDAGPIGVEQSRGRLGHPHQQRFHFVGLVPLVRDVEDGFAGGRRARAARWCAATMASASASPLAVTAKRGSGQLPRTSSTYSASAARPDRGGQWPAAWPASARPLRSRRAPALRRPIRAARPRRQFRGRPGSSNSGTVARTMAAASAFVAVMTRSSDRLEQFVDVGSLAGQVEQVRYDVWHWRDCEREECTATSTTNTTFQRVKRNLPGIIRNMTSFLQHRSVAKTWRHDSQ